jgi:hypothetical protein
MTRAGPRLVGTMPTALESAVDALSDPNVAVADALRRLLVVSRRIGAGDLSRWLMGELSGFGADEGSPPTELDVTFRLS